MGSAVGDASGKAAASFWKMSSLFSAAFVEGSSCVLSQTYLRAAPATLSPITKFKPWSRSSANAAIISKAENEKSTQKF